MANVIVAQELGQIAWNLPAALQYTPGMPLQIEVQIFNPTNINRNYKLIEQKLQHGRVIHEAVIPIDGREWFAIPSGHILTIQGTLTLDKTNVVYRMNLMEQSTNRIVDSVSVALTGVGEPPAPPPGEMDFMGPMMGIMGIAMMAGIVMPMIKERGE